MTNAPDKVKVGAWEWSVWPTAPMPTLEWIIAKGQAEGPAAVDAFHKRREEFIAREIHDPLAYGWEQPPLAVVRALLAGTYVPGRFGVAVAPANWKLERPANDIALLGGNGSGKTEVQGKLAMEVLTAKASREARCFSQNEQTSVRYIQKALFRYMPPGLRRVKRQGQTTKISYQESTGFSENVFVLPNHSTGLFPTYKGWMQDRTSVEGGECHVLTCDEEAPAEMMETIRFRAHKTGGFVLLGFTPVLGYTETVGQYIEGATVIECIPARSVVWDWWARSWSWGDWLLPQGEKLVKGCPPGHVPLVVQSGAGDGRRFAVVFPTMFNPYTNVAEVVAGTKGKPKEFALERLWGWATNRVRRAFPDFGDVHLVKPARIPPLHELTIYLWCDPHGQRNWFMAWVGVDKDQNKWVLKEWPDITMGEWALPGGSTAGGVKRHDGKEGPAQTAGGGRYFNDYKRIILEAEGWTTDAQGVWRAGDRAFKVVDRRLDPRPAGTAVPSDEEARTYLDHISAPITRDVGGARVVEFAGFRDFAAGPGCGIEEGTQLLNNWLRDGWDNNQPVTPMNCPKFYVNMGGDHADPRLRAGCQNIIWALKTWTGADGEKGASKDPVDVLKGLAKLDIRHIVPGSLGCVDSGTSY